MGNIEYTGGIAVLEQEYFADFVHKLLDKVKGAVVSKHASKFKMRFRYRTAHPAIKILIQEKRPF